MWSLFWKNLSFISAVDCSVEFDFALGVVWITDLFWLIGGMKWNEFYMVDCPLYLLFEVILQKLDTVTH